MAKTEEPESVVVQATAGPYAGQRLTLSAADAKQAIKDGWAVDPFAPPPAPDAEPPKQPTDEERVKINEAAEAAGRKLRGEDAAQTAEAAAPVSEPAPTEPAPDEPPEPEEPTTTSKRKSRY